MNNIPKALPPSGTSNQKEEKAYDPPKAPNVNHNISETAQAALRHNHYVGYGLAGQVHAGRRQDVHQMHNLDPETYIEQDILMDKFYQLMRSKLNSMFISLFASDGGFVEKSISTPLAAKLFQGVATLSPEPISAAVAGVAATAVQAVHGQKHSNRVENAVGVCLDPYLATEYARQTAIKLCAIYEDQIKKLKEEGVDRLARFAVTAIHDLLESHGLAVDQPIAEQLIEAIQETGAKKRGVGTMLKMHATQKAERFKPTKKVVNFFRCTNYKLPTQHTPSKPWKADKLVSRCGIRIHEGDEWVYYANDTGVDNKETGKRYTRAALYGFRLGTKEEAAALGMHEVKRDRVDRYIFSELEVLPSSRDNEKIYQELIEAWKTFAENCVQEIAEKNKYLSQQGNNIEAIRKEQEELREAINDVNAFLGKVIQEMEKQGRDFSQHSASLKILGQGQDELRNLIEKLIGSSQSQENRLSQHSVELKMIQEEQGALAGHIDRLLIFAEKCTQVMSNQDEHLSQHSLDLNVIREGQEELPEFIDAMKKFSDSCQQAMIGQNQQLSQQSWALVAMQEKQQSQFEKISNQLRKAVEERQKNQSQNSESFQLIREELSKLPDLVNEVKRFSESCMQEVQKLRHDTFQHLMQEEMKKIRAAIEKLDRQPRIEQRDVKNVQQKLKDFYSNKDHSTIELAFSGKTLDIKQSFVQLAIIEEVEQKRKQENEERNKQSEQLRDTMLENYETIHAIKNPVELEALFSLEHPQDHTPYRKFLLLGRAGIGKSTLCQKIAHQWATENFWRDRFSFLFWVPLRNLTEKEYPHGERYLANILAKECFSPTRDKEKMLHRIEDIKEILRSHSDKILIILDGYDETTQMPTAIHEQLFAGADLSLHMIVTSRPYGTQKIKGKMDATLENMGFADEHTEKYIANYFEENHLEEDQRQVTPRLNDFIRERRDLATMAHVPLLLEMLCLLWQEMGEKIATLSMTELYEKVVERGFERFFSHQEVRVHLREGDQLKSERQEFAERERFSLALGKIALEGMKKGKLPIDADVIKDSMKRFDIRSEEIYSCGFLKAVEGNDRKWKPGYFMHLSIQEYFAAFYLATKPSELKRTMSTYKYHPHMQLVWTMCAGLLGSKNFGEEEVDDQICQRVMNFFQMLHEQPRDLIGRYHNRLTVACLNACADRGNLYHQIEEKYMTISSLKNFIQLFLQGKSVGLDLSLEFQNILVMKRCLVAPLIERLNDEDRDVREAAARVLGEIKDERAVEPLIARLGDESWLVREAAVKALGEIKDGRAVEPLIARLGDEDPFVRRSVVKALVKIKDGRVVEPLMGSLGDENESVREAAARLLGEIKDERAVEPLIGRLGDENSLVRIAVVGALGEIKDGRAVEPLIGRLGDESSFVRAVVARALGEIKDGRAVEPLIGRLDDENSSVRRSVARALGEIKDGRAVEPLIGSLGDENESVREAAARVLGEIKDERAVEPLMGRLGDENSLVRIAVVGALGEIKDGRAVESLVARLGDENESVRTAVAEALREIKDGRAVELLIGRLGDESWLVREAAAEALGEIKDARAVEPLMGRLGDENESVRATAARLLGEIKDERAVELLMGRLSDENSRVRAAVVGALVKIKDGRAVELLIGGLDDEDWFVREVVAWALGEIKDGRAVEPLIGRLGDENSLVRAAVAEALGEIKDGRAVELLVGRLGDENESVRTAVAEALREIKDGRVAELLVGRLGDENWLVRELVAWALGEKIKDGRVAELLVGRLGDEDWHVRQAVVRALEKMEYSILLTAAFDHSRAEIFTAIVKKAFLNNQSIFLCKNEQNKYDLMCNGKLLLNSIDEDKKNLIIEGLQKALSKEFSSLREHHWVDWPIQILH